MALIQAPRLQPVDVWSRNREHFCGSAFPRFYHSIQPTRYALTETRRQCGWTLIAGAVESYDCTSSMRKGALRRANVKRSIWTDCLGKKFAVNVAGSSSKWKQPKLNGKRVRVVAKAASEEEQPKEVNGPSNIQDDVQDTSAKSGGAGQSGSVLAFLCPLLKLVGGGDPAGPRNAFLEAVTSGVASIARLPWGSNVHADVAAERSAKGQPQKLFQLYEFEACPFCRRVREALTELDLSAEVYPCPKGSLRHREFVRNNGGKEQFPYFLDPNTGVTLYESSEIVNYLFKEYGKGSKPTTGLLESTLFTGWVPTLLRAGRGMMLYSKASLTPPPNKLELYSYENNQFARLVREALCELELPYILRNAGKGSSSRNNLLQLAGSTKVPYLIDPNTGKAMAESLNIITYLFQTYGSS